MADYSNETGVCTAFAIDKKMTELNNQYHLQHQSKLAELAELNNQYHAKMEADKLQHQSKLAELAELNKKQKAVEAEAKAKKEAEKTLAENRKKHNEWNEANGIPKLDAKIEKVEREYQNLVAERKNLVMANPHKITNQLSRRIVHTDPVKRVELDAKKAKANQNYFSGDGLTKNYYCHRSNGKDCQPDGLMTAGCKKIYKKKFTRDAHSQICKCKHPKDMDGKL